MSSDLVNESKLCDQLGLITNEVFKIKDVLQKIADRQSDLKTALDGIDHIRQDLVGRVTKVESLTKDAVELAVADSLQEEEIKQSLEEEKAKLQAQLEEKGNALHASEITIKELEENLTSKIHELEERIREKARLLEIRDAVLNDLKSTAGALTALSDDLESLKEENLIALEGSTENGNGDGNGADEADSANPAKKEPGDYDRQMAAEIHRLREDLREKDILLGAKEMNLEMVKQTMGTKIADLEKLAKNGEKKKAKRFVTFLADVGKKH
jgi:DNA repair exonuclease SbcCD ATPase subunit